MPKRTRLLVIHGPNLNLLGIRQTQIYGSKSLAEIDRKIRVRAAALGWETEILQSNEEGEIVTHLQQAIGRAQAVVINPAAYTHTSVAIRDAISALKIPVVEVHLSNIFSREEFRQRSLISAVAAGVISGFGPESYLLGVEAAIALVRRSAGRRRKT